MYMKRSVPCALNATQLALVFRDIGRSINYETLKGGAAAASPRGVICQGWKEFPDWVRSVEVKRGDGEVILNIEIVERVLSAETDALFGDLGGQLARLVSYPCKPFPRHVFCIGWAKTGTTSLTDALRILGLFSWHFAPWVIGLKSQSDEIDSTFVDFSEIAEYTAVSDLPVCALFKELDEAFPGSLFILTTRSVEKWSESMFAECRRHEERFGSVGPVLRWAHSAKTVDSTMLEDRYTRHQEEVREYFGDRKDILVIDLTRGNPWKSLCAFLQVSEPNVPFPYLNRRPAE